MSFRSTIKMLSLFLLPAISFGQTAGVQDNSPDNVYYAGLNPIAPLTSIRGDFSSLYLPVASNLETGISAFVGKIWNRNYNVETRLSYGSPAKTLTLLQVQGGFMYCFRNRTRQKYFYSGIFANIRSLHNSQDDVDYASIIMYASIGKRFVYSRYFLDFRLNQHLYALSWSDVPGARTSAGFHPSIYKWKSAYMPFAGLGVGYLFR